MMHTAGCLPRRPLGRSCGSYKTADHGLKGLRNVGEALLTRNGAGAWRQVRVALGYLIKMFYPSLRKANRKANMEARILGPAAGQRQVF